MNELNADTIEHTSRLAFQPTVERLAEIIEKAGMKVFAWIDHAAAAKEAGLSMAPATVLIFGNARGGTPVMQAAPAAALDLPLRVLIRQNERGETLVAFHPIKKMLEPYKVPDELTDGLAKAQQLLIASL
jgi:uncharacterized protein (DUF302 family)